MELRRSSRLQARTRPISPTLHTRTRSRNYHIESHAEKEDKEYEEMLKYKFLAKPPPNCIFQTTPSGLPKKKKRKATKPKTPMALKRKVVSRTGLTKAKNKTSAAIKKLKALPLPDLLKVFEVTKAQCEVTKTQPFSFEEKYEKPKQVKEKLLQETLAKEKKLRQFKSKPLYESSGFQIDKNQSKCCTKISPFNLTNPDFYHDKLKKQVETVEKENKELQKKREFKANYPHVLFDEPFIPEKDSRDCKVEEFNLHSEKRGYERKKFDDELLDQKEMLEREKDNEKVERELREKKEVVELREKQIHRANKIGEYKQQAYENLS